LGGHAAALSADWPFGIGMVLVRREKLWKEIEVNLLTNAWCEEIEVNLLSNARCEEIDRM